MICGHVYLNRAGVDLIRGSATLIHAGMELIRVGMGTIRGHVGWNCSGVTDDQPPTTAHEFVLPSAVVRHLCSFIYHPSSLICPLCPLCLCGECLFYPPSGLAQLEQNLAPAGFWVWHLGHSAAGGAKGLPQTLQNLAPAGFWAWHAGHTGPGIERGLPHAWQNFAPAGLAWPHAAQTSPLVTAAAPP
jgi:hypothetical protein